MYEDASEIPEAERAKDILRRALITELLRKRPLEEHEFRRYVHQSLRQETASGQRRGDCPRLGIRRLEKAL